MNRLDILTSSLRLNQEYEILHGKLQKERKRIVDLIKEDQNPSFYDYDRLNDELLANRYELHRLFGIAAEEDRTTKPTLWQRLTKK